MIHVKYIEYIKRFKQIKQKWLWIDFHALRKYESIARKFNKPFGYHAVHDNSKKVLSMVEKGYSFIALGFDAKFLNDASSDNLKKLKDMLN